MFLWLQNSFLSSLFSLPGTIWFQLLSFHEVILWKAGTSRTTTYWLIKWGHDCSLNLWSSIRKVFTKISKGKNYAEKDFLVFMSLYLEGMGQDKSLNTCSPPPHVGWMIQSKPSNSFNKKLQKWKKKKKNLEWL